MEAAGLLTARALTVADRAEVLLRRVLPSCPHHLPLLLGVATLTGAYLTSATYRLIRDLVRTAQNDRKRKRKQEACRASIDDLEARLARHPVKESEVERITSLTLHELTGHLKARTLRPIDVLRAYQTKALEAHRRTNCLVEVITEAEEWALQLEQGPTDGMLYGVPVSLKDDIGIKSYDCALGCIELADKPMADDACLVKVLRGRHGALPFVKTNVPQTELAFEPGNPITGPVHHPLRPGHGPGGSSSGEGALVASGGSVLGVGSDVGGSIRVPAHFCGVCGFKPTHQRMSRLGSFNAPAFQSPIAPSFGPLARDVDSLAFAMKALWDGSLNDLDPSVVPMPFNSLVYEDKSKLRIGYYFHDGMFPLFPGCARAVDMTREALELRGHELVPWTPPAIEDGLELYMRVLQADCSADTIKNLKCDKMSSTLKPHMLIFMIPRVIRWVFAKLMLPFTPRLATVVDCTLGQPDVLSYWNLCKRLEDYTQSVHDSWKEKKLDAVICPPFAFASLPLGNSLLNHPQVLEYPLSAPHAPHSSSTEGRSLLPGGCSLVGRGLGHYLNDQGATFGILYNCLNFPAGVVRMTKVTSEDVAALEDYPTEDPFHRAAKEGLLQSEGLPMGVMVATLRYQDELCLRVMKEVESRAEFKVV